jgi:hypothetical protein
MQTKKNTKKNTKKTQKKAHAFFLHLHTNVS